MRGFTLIEMLVVIVIIGILMTIVFRFGGDRLQLLQMQTTKETVIGFREDVINANRTSSFLGDQQYQHVDLIRSGGSSQMQAMYYSLTGAILLTDTSTIFPQIQWRILQPDTDALTLRYIPYQLGCRITDASGEEQSQALLQLASITQPQSYCFAIRSQTCMVQEVVCEE